eukprot:gene25920-34514_t
MPWNWQEMIAAYFLFLTMISWKSTQSFQIHNNIGKGRDAAAARAFSRLTNGDNRFIRKFSGYSSLLGQLSQSLESRSLSCLDLFQVLVALKSHVVTNDARNVISKFVTSDTYSSAALRTRHYQTALERYQIVSEISNQLGYLPLQRDLTECLLSVLVKIERNLSPGPERSELAGFSLDLEG